MASEHGIVDVLTLPGGYGSVITQPQVSPCNQGGCNKQEWQLTVFVYISTEMYSSSYLLPLQHCQEEIKGWILLFLTIELKEIIVFLSPFFYSHATQKSQHGTPVNICYTHTLQSIALHTLFLESFVCIQSFFYWQWTVSLLRPCQLLRLYSWHESILVI